MQKDMLLALELGRQLDVPMPTTAVTNEFLTAARGMGLVEKDFAVVFDVLAQCRGEGMKTITDPVKTDNAVAAELGVRLYRQMVRIRLFEGR